VVAEKLKRLAQLFPVYILVLWFSSERQTLFCLRTKTTERFGRAACPEEDTSGHPS